MFFDKNFYILNSVLLFDCSKVVTIMLVHFCSRMWKALAAVLLVFVVLARDSLSNSLCPLGSPCTCVWDKNDRTRENDKRNELVCSDKGLTEKSIPIINDAGNNVTFFKVNLSLNHFDHIPVEFVDFLPGV